MEEKNKKELIELVKSLQKEKQDLEKAYIELDLECRDLRTENEELKSPKFASWKLKFFRLKEEFDKELAEHEEFAKKANSEIERLTEERDKYQEKWQTSYMNELNLQKQVDELKEKLWKSKQDMMTYHSKTVAEAVKDTAKEIYGEINDSDILVVQTQEYGEIEVVPIERLKEIIKQKCVEVE